MTNPAENYQCFGVVFDTRGTATCRCPSDRCVASVDGLRLGRVSSISDINCRACTPMNFPLSADATHRTETFGPIDNDTDQGIQALSSKREMDPTGRDAHQPGAKLDAGKIRPALVLGGFARALLAVSAVGTFGAVKYTENGWISVPNGEARYADAQLRHWLKSCVGEQCDPDTELLHLSHEAWNALAKLDLYLRKQEQVKA